MALNKESDEVFLPPFKVAENLYEKSILLRCWMRMDGWGCSVQFVLMTG